VGLVCEHSRLLCALLKAGDAHFMLKYAVRVHQQAQKSPQLAGFFRATDVLVPVPGSAPKPCRDPWVAADLADALVHEGLGSTVWPGLRRISAVRKSATSTPGARPSVSRHYESFLMERPPMALASIVLIDDVVTKGRTLLAAATRLQEAFPDAEIRAFALLRTLGLIPSVQRLLDPCRGEIRWKGGDAHRNP
jgi:predicted amidophosphoribosyltransferase